MSTITQQADSAEFEFGVVHRARLFGDPNPVRRTLARLLAAAENGRRDAVDVSHYQLAVDWHLVRATTSAPLGIAKMTEHAGYVDPYYRRNREGMIAAGYTHRVFYHWLSPTVRVKDQAAHVVRTFGAHEPGDGLMLDIEQQGVTLEMAIEAADRIEQATQQTVAGYTGRYVDGGRVWLGDRFYVPGRARVLAAYTTRARALALAGGHPWDMRQWSGSVRVPGIGPLSDINELDNLAAFDPVCGITERHDMTTADRPKRLYDSRLPAPGARLAAHEVRVLPLATPGTRAVSVALTVVGPDANGWLTAWAAGSNPGTTNVSFDKGRTVTVTSNVPCDPHGCIRIESTAGCHVIVDVQGTEH